MKIYSPFRQHLRVYSGESLVPYRDGAPLVEPEVEEIPLDGGVIDKLLSINTSVDYVLDPDGMQYEIELIYDRRLLGKPDRDPILPWCSERLHLRTAE